MTYIVRALLCRFLGHDWHALGIGFSACDRCGAFADFGSKR